jgi:hypothetical protein
MAPKRTRIPACGDPGEPVRWRMGAPIASARDALSDCWPRGGEAAVQALRTSGRPNPARTTSADAGRRAGRRRRSDGRQVCFDRLPDKPRSASREAEAPATARHTLTLVCRLGSRRIELPFLRCLRLVEPGPTDDAVVRHQDEHGANASSDVGASMPYWRCR